MTRHYFDLNTRTTSDTSAFLLKYNNFVLSVGEHAETPKTNVEVNCK